MFDREGILHAATKMLTCNLAATYLHCRNAQSQKHRDSARAGLGQASNTILAKIDTCPNGGLLALS